MNIGLVVNARGKMCLVHDEPFEATPLWVGYHVDKRRLEIIFETGATYPLDWESTDEMDRYLLAINKILIIRMENKKPVEGYDTSLLRLRGGRRTDSIELRIDNGMRGDERHGPLVLRIGSLDYRDPPCEAIYDGLSRKLIFRWPDGNEYAIAMSSRDAHFAIMAMPHVRILREAPTTEPDQADLGFDIWLPVLLSMRGDDRPADTGTMTEPTNDAAVTTTTESGSAESIAAETRNEQRAFVIGRVKWIDAERGYGFLAPEGSGADVFVHVSELQKSGLMHLQPGDPVAFEIANGDDGRQASVGLCALAPCAIAPVGLEIHSAETCVEWHDPSIWSECGPEMAEGIRAALAAGNANIPLATDSMRTAKLPYYEDGYLVHTQGTVEDSSKEWFALYSPSRDKILVLDGTGAPVFTANEWFTFRVDTNCAVSYVRFFLHFVREQSGSITPVDDVTSLPWLPSANEAERGAVADRLMAMHTMASPNPELYFVLQGTVLFKNALYLTKVLVARRPCELFDPGTAAPEYYGAGQWKFFDEELLLEGLCVRTG